MSEHFFENRTDIYDVMIDWSKRLARERSFYQRLMEQHKVGRVLDVACGTGHHAAMFHEWNLTVEGSDISPEMIARAKSRFGDSVTLRWKVRGFDEPIAAAEKFDMAICVGNSLALSPDRDAAARAVGNMVAAVRKGGVVVLHVANLWRLPEGPCLWQKDVRAELPQGGVRIVKGMHRCGTFGFVDLLVLPDAADWEMQSESVRFLGLEASEMERWLHGAGAIRTRLHGGYQDEAYDPANSVDLIVTAQR